MKCMQHLLMKYRAPNKMTKFKCRMGEIPYYDPCVVYLKKIKINIELKRGLCQHNYC